MKCLFVGGDHDGEIIDVDSDRPYYLMPCRVSVGTAASPSAAIAKAQQRQSYARHEICDADNRRHVVFVGGGNQNAPILEILMGYARLATTKHAPQRPLSEDGGELTAQSVACPTDKEK